MDQNAVVSEQIDDGKRLFDALEQNGFDVEAAYWLRDEGTGDWKLYIVTNERSKGPAAAYKTVHKTMMKLAQPVWLDPFDIVITDWSDPRAVAVRELLRQFPGPSLTRVGGRYVNDVYFDAAYIYPFLKEHKPSSIN